MPFKGAVLYCIVNAFFHATILDTEIPSVSYCISDVVLTEEDLIHGQFGLVIVDVLNCNVNLHKGIQTCRGETTANG